MWREKGVTVLCGVWVWVEWRGRAKTMEKPATPTRVRTTFDVEGRERSFMGCGVAGRRGEGGDHGEGPVRKHEDSHEDVAKVGEFKLQRRCRHATEGGGAWGWKSDCSFASCLELGFRGWGALPLACAHPVHVTAGAVSPAACPPHACGRSQRIPRTQPQAPSRPQRALILCTQPQAPSRPQRALILCMRPQAPSRPQRALILCMRPQAPSHLKRTHAKNVLGHRREPVHRQLKPNVEQQKYNADLCKVLDVVDVLPPPTGCPTAAVSALLGGCAEGGASRQLRWQKLPLPPHETHNGQRRSYLGRKNCTRVSTPRPSSDGAAAATRSQTPFISAVANELQTRHMAHKSVIGLL
eukprot:362451-Chlamydomonas_euryale.AAC.3